MKYSILALSIFSILALSACNNSDSDQNEHQTEIPSKPGDGAGTGETETGEAVPEDEVIPQAKLLFSEDFKNLSALPADWKVIDNNPGTVQVRDGHLYIDGRNHSTQMTTVMLPEKTQQYTDYRVDVEFTYLNANNSSRWGSIIYRANAAQANNTPNPYYQFAIRSAATASNGTEFALRENNQWNVMETAAYTENIDPNRTYTATVIVQGNRVRQYLNGALLHDAEMSTQQRQGGIGLSTAGLEMRVDRIKVTEQLEKLPSLQNAAVNVQDAATQVSVAPTIIQRVSNSTNLYTDRASQWAFTLDAELNLLDQNGQKHGRLQQFLSDTQRRVIPLLAIKDEATLNALAAISEQSDLTDISLYSDNEDLLRKAHGLVPNARTVLDLSQASQWGSRREDLQSIVFKTNRSFARIVILPEHLINKANVAYLQQRLLTVWGQSQANSMQAAGQILVSGLNGILTEHSVLYNNILAAMPYATLLRKPLVVGHRGVPSLEDENTLEGAKRAVELGADAVENDIYITKDNHLVIMHDATVDRTTNGKGLIEDMTLAEVKQLKTQVKGYAVPTMAEYFKAFKNNKKIVHFIELKSGNEKIVPQLKKEIEEYGIQDQVVTISFDTAQIKRMKNILPEYSTGFLTGNVPKTDNVLKDVKKLMGVTQSYASTFNPSFGNLQPSLLEAAKHRGITFWPWTYRDADSFKRHYVAGINGLTTDYSQFASDYVVDLKTATTAQVKVGDHLNFPTTLITQNGQQRQVNANQLIVLSAQQAQHRNSGTLSYKSAGTAYVIPGYKYSIDGQYAYTIFTQPVKITVTAP
ncbi:glycerophosphodiester phosphodiesterase family protein [Acinetobacter rudis]|uniref:glycerophosphodiester phosphodiesterase family protein n=1 Tax=Acinetobacter rudis TaxID=632955 RepID=UPI00280D6D50|nr:glycerophosphodiester phosphodiesterase family protein [Acinetobacter rudis]MDQ8952344.1 glycerophosphodiester phosphodiesterase family protein [Acinetobacter rudis]